jgi:hypothetical protein
VHAAFGERAVRAAHPGRAAREPLDAVVDALQRPDVELAGGHRRDHFVGQHQVPHIGARDHHALLAGEPAGPADAAGPEAGFRHDVGDVAQTGGQLALVLASMSGAKSALTLKM